MVKNFNEMIDFDHIEPIFMLFIIRNLQELLKA